MKAGMLVRRWWPSSRNVASYTSGGLRAMVAASFVLPNLAQLSAFNSPDQSHQSPDLVERASAIDFAVKPPSSESPEMELAASDNSRAEPRLGTRPSDPSSQVIRTVQLTATPTPESGTILLPEAIAPPEQPLQAIQSFGA